MKKQGSNCDYTQSRNDLLKKEFLARLGHNGRSLEKIFIELANIRAPRFFISEERAYRLMRQRGGASEADDMSPKVALRQKITSDIMDRVDRLMDRDPSLSLREAVFITVNSPAPSFYLTPGTIRTIIYSKTNNIKTGS